MAGVLAVLPSAAVQLRAPGKRNCWSGELETFQGRMFAVKKIGRSRGEKCYSGIYSQLQLPSSPRDIRRIQVPAETPVVPNKGWTNDMGMDDQWLGSKLSELIVQASDRTEMHRILAIQRDNWNKLFHSTIAIASVSAATATAVNGVKQALGLSVVASILGVGVAMLMVLVNKAQPSQLAEEQRHAARFFKHLTTDIEATLQNEPQFRDEASHYWEEKIGTLHALDAAFPLPLTPVVLERFPKVVRPSILSPPVDLSASVEQFKLSSTSKVNGWTRQIETDLEATANLLHSSDVPTYVGMGKGVNQLNKFMAITSPLLAAAGALCSICCCAMPGLPISGLGASFTMGAFFFHSLSHAVQLGAAFETYRNCAGYYAEVEKSIQKALSMPVEQREDGVVFRLKVACLLGRNPAQFTLVQSDDKTAGTLF